MAVLKLFLSAGEASGDLHGANLMKELRGLRSDIEFFGLAGPQMAEQGCMPLEDMVAHSGMWFMHVWKNFFWYLGLLKRAVKSLDVFKPDALILIDSPAFNVRLALHAKERGIPVIYYITPQAWAWGTWRINKIRRRVDKMVAILPFERDFWLKFGMDAEYVGHPLFDHLCSLDLPPDVQRQQGKVGLLPGSRITEVAKLLPIMLGAARIIAQEVPGAHFAVACPTDRLREVVEAIIEKHDGSLNVVLEDTHHLIRSSMVCMTACGTATLELADSGTPMVVIYRVVWYGKPLCPIFVTTDYISLVNIIAGCEVVPELCMFRNDYRGLADRTVKLLKDEDHRNACKQRLKEVSRLIAKPGASKRAAEAIVTYLRGEHPSRTA